VVDVADGGGSVGERGDAVSFTDDDVLSVHPEGAIGKVSSAP